jgi:hypothetical protein
LGALNEIDPAKSPPRGILTVSWYSDVPSCTYLRNKLSNKFVQQRKCLSDFWEFLTRGTKWLWGPEHILKSKSQAVGHIEFQLIKQKSDRKSVV